MIIQMVLIMTRTAVAIIGFACTLASASASAQFTLNIDIEAAPIRYTETPANNRVSRLIEKIKRKEITIDYTDKRGNLVSLLEALEIPQSSQTLVFSKTSMQIQYISRRNPRAIYFNDDTYLGWVNGSSLVEISTADPKLGAAFYTVRMNPWRPKIERANYDCLACHATTMTKGIPGHTVRSVMPTYDGNIDSQAESFLTNDRSPFAQRWGGWYVTGVHGSMKHLGNAYLKGGILDTRNSANRKNVNYEFDTSKYLSPYSDIVALMVLEHQTQMHNSFARASFFTRKLLFDAKSVAADGQTKDEEVLGAQISMIAEEVVERLLFSDETVLTDEVRGSVVFARDFQSRGRKNSTGRSLRDFDMKTRMFRYPCSYLIYSDAFISLEPKLRAEIVRQTKAVLEQDTTTESMAHLSAEDRTNILSILKETHPDF